MTEKEALNTIILFKKHKGKTFEQVVIDDVGYVQWMNTLKLNGELEQAIKIVTKTKLYKNKLESFNLSKDQFLDANYESFCYGFDD